VPLGLGINKYQYSPCGNASDIVTRPCVLTCTPLGVYYLKGKCQLASTGVCTRCTAMLQGSFMVRSLLSQLILACLSLSQRIAACLSLSQRLRLLFLFLFLNLLVLIFARLWCVTIIIN
jgi:hypothetical protein